MDSDIITKSTSNELLCCRDDITTRYDNQIVRYTNHVMLTTAKIFSFIISPNTQITEL